MTDGRITDPQALRALSHPTRWKLIELLGLENTATATRCAEYSGESVASCSYHLNMLAKYGFVEHAAGGQGRERPWKLTHRDQNWSAVDADSETALAAETLSEVFLDHETAQVKDWVRRASMEPREWQQAAGIGGRTVDLTAGELTAVLGVLDAALEPYRHRRDDPSARPDDARVVRLLTAAWLPRTSS
ncbi:MAG: winged helix-turn-helix transcriptional regulator [Pseudonocardia sp.]|nr:winged helix-turn-helix transcriptional regulator [Pseudonocardia sp.]